MDIDGTTWYKSKTKWAGILAGLGLALPSIITWLSGGGFELDGFYKAVIVILGVFGVRDAL